MKRATYGLFIDTEEASISIHALVKRATKRQATLHTQKEISIHALVKRATPTG